MPCSCLGVPGTLSAPTAACTAARFSAALPARGVVTLDHDDHTGWCEPEPAAARPGSPVFSRVRDVGWDVPVKILRFQKEHAWTVVHSATVRDAVDLAEAAEDACDDSFASLTFIPVSPQPEADHPVLLSAPANFRKSGQVPVCLELLYESEGRRVWMEFVESPIRLEAIQFLMANEWREGSTALAGTSGVSLGSKDVPVAPGDLIRILRPGHSRPRGV